MWYGVSVETIVLHVPEKLSREVLTATRLPLKVVADKNGKLTYTNGGNLSHFVDFVQTIPRQISLPTIRIPKKEVAKYVLTKYRVWSPFLREEEGYFGRAGDYLTFRPTNNVLTNNHLYFSTLRNLPGSIGGRWWLPANFPLGKKHKYLYLHQIEEFVVGARAVRQVNKLYHRHAGKDWGKPLPIFRGHADDAIIFGSVLWLANVSRPTIPNNLLSLPILRKFGISEKSAKRTLAWSAPLRRAMKVIIENTFPRIEATIDGGALFGSGTKQLYIPGGSQISLSGEMNIEKLLYAPEPPTLHFPISAIEISSRLKLSEARLSTTRRGFIFLVIKYVADIRIKQEAISIKTEGFKVMYKLSSTPML